MINRIFIIYKNKYEYIIAKLHQNDFIYKTHTYTDVMVYNEDICVCKIMIYVQIAKVNKLKTIQVMFSMN